MTNPYWEAIQKLPTSETWGHLSIERFNRDFIGNRIKDYRDELVTEYAWAIPSPDALQVIANFAPRICEIGAGTGYWAKMLTQYEVSIIAYDIAIPGIDDNEWRHKKTHFTVLKGDANSIQNHQDHALMLCWPPYRENVALDALKAYTGNKLIYIGEGEGGCTANDEFHELMRTTFQEHKVVDIPQWEGIHDRVYLMER